MADALGFVPDPPIRARGSAIGCIGAGMIVAECHLAAYARASFSVVAIASRHREHGVTATSEQQQDQERNGHPQRLSRT